MKARLLLAEDDPKQVRVIRAYLEREGHEVLACSDGRSALDLARARQPDLLVLDVMLPDVDGLDVCRILRAESTVPILMLTARSTENDLLLGLDLGADDYMTKPYRPRELTARVRALLRRSHISRADTDTIALGQLTIDPRRFEVLLGAEPVQLTAKEFDLLLALARDPGRVFTRAQLIERAFGFASEVVERTVDVHIKNLRQKLEQDPSNPLYIRTVTGRGYRFTDDTE